MKAVNPDHGSDPQDDSSRALADIEPVDAAGEATSSSAPTPFTGLRAPAPQPPEPSTAAKVGAVVAVAISGALGAAIGWGTGEILLDSPVWAAISALVFAVGAAAGVGIVVALTLRASAEWSATRHPEDERQRDRFGRTIS